MKKLNIIFLLLIMILFFGCIETKQKYTLNPDGSGKVIVESLFQQMNITMGGGEDREPEIQMKKAIKKIIEKSKGVDVWKDIKYKLKDDGRIWFKGTAYFKDLSKLELHDMSMMRADFYKSKKDEMVLELKDEKESTKSKSQKIKQEKMTEDEIKKMVLKQKAGYQQMKPMLTAFLSTMKMDSTFKLPGKIKNFINFKKEKDRTVSIVFKGEKLLKVLDSFTSDDKWWRKQVKAGKDMKQDSLFFDPMINEKLFGEKGPIKVTISRKFKPLFKYKSEVAKARKKYPGIIKELKIKKKEITKPLAKGGKFKSLKVGGIKIVRISDWEKNIRAFYSEKGYTLSLVGELPGAVLKITGGKLKKAITDNGKSVLPEDEWKRDIKFYTLSKDKTSVNFELEMKLPSSRVKKFKEISGYLEYISASGLKKTDLGISKFKEGTRGKKYGAIIKSVKESQWQKGSYNLELDMDVSIDSVKSITFYNKDKTTLDAYELSRGPIGNKKSKFIFSYKGTFPDRGSIIIKIYEKTKKYSIPFKLKNLSLLGK